MTWLHGDTDGKPMVFISDSGAEQKAAAIREAHPAVECRVRAYYIRGEMTGYVIRCTHNL